jgi:hypothetical protein
MALTSCVVFLASAGCDRFRGKEHKGWEAGELKHIKKIGREIKGRKGEVKRAPD